MNKILVLKAFDKAAMEIKKRGIQKPSPTEIALELSIFIADREDFDLGERSLRDYRAAAEKWKEENKDISIKQLAVINGLCRYLGFENYQGFVESIGLPGDQIKEVAKETKGWLPNKLLLLISMSLIVLIGLWTYHYTQRQKWMLWQENQYIEVDFDANKYRIKQLLLYNENRISSFHKVEVSCDTLFFNTDASVRFWYGKNKNKKVEYFTGSGVHPETGKTLKSISQYMIDKYVCGKK
jgi:hypothetical protein